MKRCAAIFFLFAALAVPGAAESAERLIVAFGDSLTAGAGVPQNRSYPAQLEARLRERGFPYRVINAGISGETTAGGLSRVDRILKMRPQIVILELGANDGLRGSDINLIRKNLDAIIDRLLKGKARVLLAGMKIPPNYGPEYTEAFARLYEDLSKKYNLPLIPFFLEGVALKPELMQEDGLHPTAEGYNVIVENLWPVLTTMLRD